MRYDLYQFNALAEKLRTFGDVDAVAFEGLSADGA